MWGPYVEILYNRSFRGLDQLAGTEAADYERSWKIEYWIIGLYVWDQ